jgi:hypothetical protein
LSEAALVVEKAMAPTMMCHAQDLVVFGNFWLFLMVQSKNAYNQLYKWIVQL